MRKEAWKYLLGFYPFEMTDIERMELRERRESEYWTMKNQWQSFTPDQENRFAKWRELKHLISELLKYMTLYIYKSCYVVRYMSEIKVVSLVWLVFFSTK